MIGASHCIQEEDADEVDRQEMLDDLIDIAEDSPLFVITDETCKEAERIDEAIFDLTRPDSRFHFWSSSAFAHGTPGAARRYRLATQRVCPPTIKQVKIVCIMCGNGFMGLDRCTYG